MFSFFKKLSYPVHNFVILQEKVSFRLSLQYKWTLDDTYFQILISISQCIILILLQKILSQSQIQRFLIAETGTK